MKKELTKADLLFKIAKNEKSSDNWKRFMGGVIERTVKSTQLKIELKENEKF